MGGTAIVSHVNGEENLVKKSSVRGRFGRWRHLGLMKIWRSMKIKHVSWLDVTGSVNLTCVYIYGI